MPIMPFAPYAPDLSPFETGNAAIIQNVYPRGDGYGPVNTLSTYSQALPGICRGLFYARNADASVTVFAATATRLYRMNNTDFSWTDVSQGGLAYSAVPNNDQWQFTQFNNLVIAVQINTPPQVYDLTAAVPFANLAAAAVAPNQPPQARYVTTVNRFIVLSGMGSTTPYRIQWSALNSINAANSWTPGVNQSDFQDLPDGGVVRGVAGGEYGLIMQDSAIRRMTFAPGTAYVFQIERVAQDIGIFAPLSLVRGGDRLFYCGNNGFQMVLPGAYPSPIGKERVDRSFFADVDSSALQLVIGAYDPNVTRIYFTYKSLAGAANLFDKILIYDYALDKWSIIGNVHKGEYIATLAKPGLTLENLDTISGSIDALPFSLDSVATGSLAAISMMNSLHQVCFVAGPPAEATLETQEIALDMERRVRVRGLRLISDAPGCFGSVSGRENLQQAVTLSGEQQVNDRGMIHQNVSTRMARGHVRIPAGTVWTFATGVDPLFAQEGKR